MRRVGIRALSLVLLLAFRAALAAPPASLAQGGPIKIGFLAPLTGPFAQIGKNMVNGTELFLDEIGRQMAGRKVELIVEDTEGQPATALNKSRKLTTVHEAVSRGRIARQGAAPRRGHHDG